MTRGVLYIVWGKYNQQELDRSINSLRPWGLDYHVEVVKDEGLHLAHKAQMYNVSPFDTTLYLDTDTVVKGDLYYGFEQAEKHQVACCIAPASSGYLAGRQIGMNTHPELPQYNTGVIFFSDNSYKVFNRWRELVQTYPRSRDNDQPTFSQSLYSLDVNPYVLPRTWNLRTKVRYESKIIHGEIKIIHAH